MLEATGAIAAIPELARLDAQTGHALVEVFRSRRARLAGLRIGHDPALVAEPIAIVPGGRRGWTSWKPGMCDDNQARPIF